MSRSNLFTIIKTRTIFGIIFLISFGALSYALYSQFVYHVEPCPLCIAQRVIYAIISVFSLAAILRQPKSWGNIIYGLITLGFGIFGAKVAYHHVWLQSLPPEQWPASCGMPLSILYKQIPLTGFIHTILSGTAECAMVNWKILGISGPMVSLWGFGIISILAILTIVARKPRPYISNY